MPHWREPTGPARASTRSRGRTSTRPGRASRRRSRRSSSGSCLRRRPGRGETCSIHGAGPLREGAAGGRIPSRNPNDDHELVGGVMQLRSNQIIFLAAVAGAAAIFACAAATGDSDKGSDKAKSPAAAAAAPLAPATAVAVIGDKTITLVDLDAQAAGALVRVRQEEYEARKQALDGMINDEIMAKEASAKGKSKDDLIKAEVTDKVTDPAQTEVDAFYEQDKVRLVYRDYPLSFHQNANIAAQASECAKDQGKFWEMHDAMFANQSKLTQPDLLETAGSLKMDKDKFKTCLDAGKYKNEVQKDFDDGQKYGVTGTPTFFINGIPMVGARDVNSFADLIDAELDRKK